MNIAKGTRQILIAWPNEMPLSDRYLKQCPRLAKVRKIPKRVPELTKVKKYR